MLLFHVGFVVFGLSCWGEALDYTQGDQPLPFVRNANHIFNTIHSSMRQWGSSLNHNGMSIFPAIVPKGTVLYHGAGTKDTVTGMEWVAFERDHAMNFAHLFLTPAPGPQIPEGANAATAPTAGRLLIEPREQNLHIQQRLLDSEDPLWIFPGYLHIYTAKRDLNLVYLDGTSAAKTTRGTLDVSDILLLNDTRIWINGEHERASRLCQIAAEDWSGRVDGFIRMEAGFEIIICSFDDSLRLVEALRTEALYAKDGLVTQEGIIFHWLRAAASRYDGIGGYPRRVQLNYDNFFTAYTSPFDLFINSSTALPRLVAVPQGALNTMRRELKSILLRPGTFDEISEKVQNWQMVADMIVQKYADALKYLITSPEFSASSTRLTKELNYMLRPFIDTSNRDLESETTRCASEFIPVYSSPASLSKNAIYTVSYRICSTLVSAYWSLDRGSAAAIPMNIEANIPTKELASLSELVSYLAWTEWKKCRGCSWDEFCSIPMFPFGDPEDHENPRCRNESNLGAILDYWIND